MPSTRKYAGETAANQYMRASGLPDGPTRVSTLKPPPENGMPLPAAAALTPGTAPTAARTCCT